MEPPGSGLPDLPPAEAVRAGGVTLRVRRLAPAAGTGASRLVALHGGPGLDHHVLLPLGLALAERYEVWLPDLPGHGASAAPHAPPPGLRTLEERLGRWLRGLEGGPGALLGHSLGAWLVRELLRPERGPLRVAARAVVLLSPPAAGQRRSGTALRRAGELITRGRAAGRRESRARREVRALVEAETGGRASPLFQEALGRARLRDARLYGALAGELHRRLVAPARPFDPGCPVLVLCGEEDRTTPPEQAAQVAEGLEGARLELLPGTGHYPMADALEPTARAVRDFLDPLL
ncbi:MAG TPA: alpha/beta hydrolase [Thermoanaerobaculia bacterium]